MLGSAWLLIVLDSYVPLGMDLACIAELRAAWWLAVATLLPSLPWALGFLRLHWPQPSWSVPHATPAAPAELRYNGAA